MSQPDRDRRTGLQWLDSAIAYCEWRSGRCWRKRWIPEQHLALERDDYVLAIRLLTHLRYSPESTASPDPVPSPENPRIAELAAATRAWLVDRLMQLDPQLTDRNLLLHFRREKLAAMLLSREPARPLRPKKNPRARGARTQELATA